MPQISLEFWNFKLIHDIVTTDAPSVGSHPDIAKKKDLWVHDMKESQNFLFLIMVCTTQTHILLWLSDLKHVWSYLRHDANQLLYIALYVSEFSQTLLSGVSATVSGGTKQSTNLKQVGLSLRKHSVKIQ